MGLLALAAAAVVPGCSSPARGAGEPRGIFKLDHLIFIVQENRSFDHYFGTFPGADGFDMRDGKPTNCVPDPVLGHPSCVYHTRQLRQKGGPHNWRSARTSIDGGKMDGFIRSLPQTQRWCVDRYTKECGPYTGPDHQPDVMSYHDRREIPNYWTYAEHFVLQDRMFAPVDSWTLPSHLFLVSGWSASCTDPHDPMSCTSNKDLRGPGEMHLYGEPPNYAWTDITWLLAEHDVSWAYYTASGTCPFGPCDDPVTRWGWTPSAKNPLPGFTDLYETRQQRHIRTHQQYFDAAANGTLPAVSWIVPGNEVSEHPQSGRGIQTGQAYVTHLINAAMRGPDWETTAIFLTWDDWGGFYDHVPPTVVDRMGYGLRVPGLLISPYAKAGYIDHQTLSFDAYLKLIEDRFLGGERLDPATLDRPDSRPFVREEEAALGDLADEFDFTQPPRPPLLLDPTPFK
jgi:phospholipase C